MHKYILLAFTGLILFAENGHSQTYSQDKAVPLQGKGIPTSGNVELNWSYHANATIYRLYRRPKDTTGTWGWPYVNLIPSTDTIFLDTNVVAGKIYEYKLERSGVNGQTYLFSGYNIPEVDHFGTLILVIDSTHKKSLATEIDRLEKDIVADGWTVIREYVNPSDAVTSVKSTIKSHYDNAPEEVKAVFLLGHVPVPYSGNIAPDGHGNHVGAWAADCFYGEMTSTWTDATVNNTSAAGTINDNTPGDGKYDQSTIPSDIELYVGRVDMFDLPAFTETEYDLLKAYLDRNHRYRNAMIDISMNSLVDDNFQGYSEGFAQNGYRNFGPLVGRKNIKTGNYRNDLTSKPYYFSYGCGAGTNSSCSGIINTTQCTTDSLQTIFTMVFGSYFGDYNKSNNLLRAVVGSGSVLSNIWAGRPNHFLHAMAIGEPIGYCWKASINNSNAYSANNHARHVHVALMGDPSLRAYPVKPVSNVVVNNVNGKAQLTWTASSDSNIVGYNVYYKSDSMQHFTRANATWVTGTSFNDQAWLSDPGSYDYMVRAVRSEYSPSGHYYNMSTGVCAQVTSTGVEDHLIAIDFDVYPNPGEGLFNIALKNTHEPALVTLMDINGKRVLTHQIGNKQNGTLDIRNLVKPGMYLIKLESAGFAPAVKKVVVR